MNRNQQAQTLIEMTRKEIANIHTAAPGTILSYDPGSGLATIKPLLKFKVPDGRVLDMPVIVGVPVVFPSGSGGNASVTFPLKSGDGCLLIFAEGSLDDWLKGGESEDLRKHDLTDAIAIPGLYNFGVSAIQAHPNDTCLKNGATVLRVEAGGNVHIEGADLIVGGISFLQHIHPESIGSVTGAPQGG